ncbi:MAG TPA: chemotaxis-specific protein-glutamate methyltransferase CheB [Solirubrobacteraceae bacterium]|nr:chemotaxis-specific protein-glutamate methyltransferase CheB [Solirubrobacteraceae bacterium]
MTTSAPTRVVVADDSAMMRQIVSTSLTRAGVQVVGTAANGDEALAACERERPDALMLDLTMPGLDGIGVLRTLRQRGRSDMPVIVVSAFSPEHGARAVDALAEGAFDLVAKPKLGDGLDGFAAELVDKVRAATARMRPVPWRTLSESRTDATGSINRVVPRRHRAASGAKAVLIATSTGGPKALADLVPKLPARLGLGTLIVQHMPPGFTKSLSTRLDQSSRLTVREAAGGERLDPAVALLAPGGLHMRLGNDGRVNLTDEPEIGALRPRADLMIEDAAKFYGDRTVLVVMTGMGNDGLVGAREVRRRGGRILVEAQSTCTVYGMPRAVNEAKLADEVLPLHELAQAITEEAA